MSRSRHGCDVFTLAGTQHLVVYCGIFAAPAPITSQVSTALSTIEFLNMSDLSKGWFQIPGVQLKKPVGSNSGGLVNGLLESFCDMMLIEFGNVLNKYNGDYTWTSIKISLFINTGIAYAPV